MAYAGDPDILTPQVKHPELGRRTPKNGNAHPRAGIAAQPVYGFLQSVAPHRGIINGDDDVARLDARPECRSAVDWCNDRYLAVGRGDLETHTRVATARADANILVLIGVKVLGMRIEVGNHAPHCAFHQPSIIDRLDVVGLYSLHDLGKEARLLPGQIIRLAARL